MLKRAILDAASATPGVALLAAALLVSSALQARAQETGGILALITEAPLARPAAPSLEVRTLGIEEAVLAAERLGDDVLVLSRIAALQTRLLETNATRAAAGARPLLLPRHICAASPLGPMCGRLAHTFASGERP